MRSRCLILLLILLSLPGYALGQGAPKRTLKVGSAEWCSFCLQFKEHLKTDAAFREAILFHFDVKYVVYDHVPQTHTPPLPYFAIDDQKVAEGYQGKQWLLDQLGIVRRKADPPDATWVPLREFDELRQASQAAVTKLDGDVQEISDHYDALAERSNGQDKSLAALTNQVAQEGKAREGLQQQLEALGAGHLTTSRQLGALKDQSASTAGAISRLSGDVQALQESDRQQTSLLRQLVSRQGGVSGAANASASVLPHATPGHTSGGAANNAASASSGGAHKNESSQARRQQFPPLTGRLLATLVHGAPLAISVAEMIGLGVTTGGVGLAAVPVARWGIGMLGSVLIGGFGAKRRRQEGRREDPFPVVESHPIGPYQPYDTGRIRSADGGPVVDRFAGLVR